MGCDRPAATVQKVNHQSSAMDRSEKIELKLLWHQRSKACSVSVLSSQAPRGDWSVPAVLRRVDTFHSLHETVHDRRLQPSFS